MVTRHITPTSQGFPSQQAPFVEEAGFTIKQPWYQLLQQLWQRTGGPTGSLTVPSGTVAAFGGATPPGGWLTCDGSAVSRATYSDLFNAIGTIWGSGDGGSTFNLPDLQGKMVLGVDGTHALASTGGAENVTISVLQMPPHQHVLDDPGHVHAALVASSTNTAGAAAGTSVAGDTASATTGITMEDTGGGQPITTISPYAGLIYIIKI